VKSAADTLDADLPLYREQQRRYATSLDAIDKRLAMYKTMLAEQATYWRPIEATLDDNDVEFELPELAAQELQRDLTKAHCAAVDDLTNEEQRYLDREKRQARNMANLCDATKATIDEKRQTRQAAKSAVGSPMAAVRNSHDASTSRKLELDDSTAKAQP
jgi:hypothetical protein